MFEHVYAKISPEPNTGCWIWDGSISSTGYGNVSVVIDGKRVTRNAHRLLYELEKGPIKKGLIIDHLCRNRWCVNPEHLEPVSHRENTVRGIGPQVLADRQLTKTHCARGHIYSDENTYRYVGRKGKLWRGCVTCRRENVVKFRAKKR